MRHKHASLLDTSWRLWEIGLWCIPVIAFFMCNEGRYGLITQILIIGLFAISLDMILGFAGILSLGHAAFFGLGAYVAGWLPLAGVDSPLLGLLGAVVASGLLGLCTGSIIIRKSALTQLMLTLSIDMVLFEAATKASHLTGGVDVLQGIEIAPLLSLWPFDFVGVTAYWYLFVVTMLTFIFVRTLLNSAFGLSLRAIQANATRSEAIGLFVQRRLVIMYVFSAMVAGIAGALLTQSTQFVSPDVLGFQRSAKVVLILIIGGIGTKYGGLIGATVLMLLQTWLADIHPQYWSFGVGILLIMMAMMMHHGTFTWDFIARRIWQGSCRLLSKKKALFKEKRS